MSGKPVYYTTALILLKEPDPVVIFAAHRQSINMFAEMKLAGSEPLESTKHHPLVAAIKQIYLTQCIHQLVLANQPPFKNVNFIFELVIVKSKLTILSGS